MLNVNEYFEGKVKSIGFNNAEGKVTAGVMDAGEYEFGTSENELMKVTSGTLKVKLPGSDSFADYPAGTEFSVAANQSFQLIVEAPAAYICIYG